MNLHETANGKLFLAAFSKGHRSPSDYLKAKTKATDGQDQVTLHEPEAADCAPTLLLVHPSLGNFLRP